MKTGQRTQFLAAHVALEYLRTGNMLLSCADSIRSTRPVSTCDRRTMGAARPPCAGGPYRTARCQAADGHDHALTDGQRKRAARTLTGAMVPYNALFWILPGQTRKRDPSRKGASYTPPIPPYPSHVRRTCRCAQLWHAARHALQPLCLGAAAQVAPSTGLKLQFSVKN